MHCKLQKPPGWECAAPSRIPAPISGDVQDSGHPCLSPVVNAQTVPGCSSAASPHTFIHFCFVGEGGVRLGVSAPACVGQYLLRCDSHLGY